MTHIKKHWWAYLIGIAVIIYMMGKRADASNNVPSSFNSRSCGGVFSQFSTSYYIENGKYFTRRDGGFFGIGIPNEISKSDYISAYNESKKPCDPLLA